MLATARQVEAWVGADLGQELLTTPNLITLSGYAAGLAWLAGGSPAWVLWSLAADELDGEAARNLDQTSSLGANLDWGVDVAFAAMLAMRLGAWWLAPAMLLTQSMLRDSEVVPPFGSVRALGMLYAVARGV